MKTNRHAAFTLMELMISLALALLLILGINEVFGLTAKTVGAGQALASAYQSDRGAQIVMARDLNNVASTAPLMITSQFLPAFRSSADMQTDVDGNPLTVDTPGNLLTIPANVLHYRNHRLDTLGMFVRDFFQRQTGFGGAFLSPGNSYEAYVWYGHVSQNTAGSGYQLPGQTGNLYAGQWVLGRIALLLQATPNNGFVSGLTYNSKSSDNAYFVQQSRYDVVQGTIDTLTSALDPPPPGVQNANWWGSAGSNNMSAAPSGLNYRFQCDPKPSRPLTADAAAFCAPTFLSGCSQFCVEFAGDFVTQDPTTGNIVPPDPTNASSHNGPDGIVDFRIVNGTRQIMWYGLARNVVGDNNFNPLYNSNRPDVDSVQNIWKSGGLPTGTGNDPPAYTFEHPATTGSNEYIAAWHPTETNNPRPKLIRITWAVEDPNSRLGLPVTFEYVFPVP